MKDDPRALGRWLKNREKVPVRAVQGRNLCETPLEVVAEISHFWNEFWACNQHQNPEQICATLLQSAHRPAIAAVGALQMWICLLRPSGSPGDLLEGMGLLALS